ncbi:uncharacterized protein LOC144511380 [Mustelus asterias]
MMLSGRPLFSAGRLVPGTGDLVGRLPPPAQAERSLWIPLGPAGNGQRQGSGCRRRRGPLKLAEDGSRTGQLPGRHPRDSLEGLGNMDTQRPIRPGGAATRPAVGGKDRPCRGVGRTMEAENGPSRPTGHTAEACVGQYYGVGPTAEAESRLYHAVGPTVEAEDRLYHGVGPTVEAEGRLYHGVGPTVEAEGILYHGIGPTAEAEGRLYHGVCPTAEAEGRAYHGAGPTAEAEGRAYHGAGPTAEAEGRPYPGVGPTVEAEGRLYHGAGPTEEAEGRAYHGAGPTVEAEGRPYIGTGPTVEAEGRAYHGAGQGGNTPPAICVCKDDGFKEQTELHQHHQWREQSNQATGGTVTKATGLSEAQEGTGFAGLVTMATVTVGGQAQLCDAARAGERATASGCEEKKKKKAEEQDDEFGSFEKAGNLVHWAEFPGPLGPEWDSQHQQSEATAGWSQEPGPSNGAAESICPPSSTAAGPTLASEGGWRAFHSDGTQTQEASFEAFPLHRWEDARWSAGEKWWLPALAQHTVQPKASPESSLGKPGLDSVFQCCFPAVSSTSSRDPIPPLGQLLGAEKVGEGFMSVQARDLWDSLQNADQAVGLKYRWSECQSRKHLLASLCVDPAHTETLAAHMRTLDSSPLLSRETTMELQSSPVTSDRDYKELMFIKNSVPPLQNGLSPTHRIQAFFYHWTQADRNGKSKTSYDFNKNFTA